MKAIEIWSEGYAATGDRGFAELLGVVYAENFDEAIDKYLSINKVMQTNYRLTDGHHFIWGCRLFDNEADARKSFG